MTGDESYHAACFTCRSCSRQIQELVFAKTSNGIYCMACHNERVARSRRHAEQKRNKSKSSSARKDRDRGKEKDKDRRERDRSQDVPVTPSHAALSPSGLSGPSPQTSSQFLPDSNLSSSPLPQNTPHNVHPAFPFPAKRASSQSIHRVLEEAGHSVGMSLSSSMPPTGNRLDTPPPSRPTTSLDHNSPRNRVDTLPLPGSENASPHPHEGRRRKSYDDGVRPLSHFLNPSSAAFKSPSLGGNKVDLDMAGHPPTSRADKRRSINPSMFLDNSTLASVAEVPPSTTPPAPNGRLSPNQQVFVDPSPRSPAVHDAYFSPAVSPVPGENRRMGSRSPSPAATSQIFPHPVNSHSTPPSVSVISPTPGQTPNQHLQAESAYDPTTGPPVGALLSDSQSRSGRSYSPSPNRSPSPNPTSSFSNLSRESSQRREDSQSPIPSLNGRRTVSPLDLSDGGETDGDIVVVPREGRKSVEAQEDVPPTPPPKEPSPADELEESNEPEGAVQPTEENVVAPLVVPALPPMRFSLGATDFTDLLNSVGDSGLKIPTDAEGERGPDADTTLTVVPPAPPPGPDPAPPQDEHDITVVIAPPSASTVPDTPTSPHNSTPTTSTFTVKDDQPEQLVVDIPPSDSSSAPQSDDPSPTSAVSAFSVSSYALPDSTLPTTSRPGTAPSNVQHIASLVSVTDRQAERQRVDSSASVPSLNGTIAAGASGSVPIINVSAASTRHGISRADSNSVDLVARRVREALTDATERGSTSVKLDREFIEAIIRALDANRDKNIDLRGQIDNIKRTSQQYMNGLTIAQSEYQKEVATRRDAEAEITRLRVQLSGQAARLTAMSAEQRRQDMLEQRSKDLAANLGVLEKDLSSLKVQRDLTLAEVEELANKSPSDVQSPVLAEGPPAANLTRSLTTRFDNLKHQYRKELEPLRQQREALIREINELKEARDIFLEETTALNARNEELADLNAQIQRQIEIAVNEGPGSGNNAPVGSGGSSSGDHHMVSEAPMSSPEHAPVGRLPKSSGMPGMPNMPSIFGGKLKSSSNHGHGSGTATPVSASGPPSNSPSFSSVNTSVIGADEKDEFGRVVKVAVKHEVMAAEPAVVTSAPAKKFKWFGNVSGKDKEKKHKVKAHNFHQQNVLKFSSCGVCGEKLWGPQLKCVAPSMFGRDLVDQVRADARGTDRVIPVIVEKCIEAVEALAMDYEGIYRKTGGSSQTKAITQLFERGNYDAFDLKDTNAFNDICSVTSVLKTYFRMLPNPLLTYALHDAFVDAACIKEPRDKHVALLGLVSQLPREHYHTLRYLILHLYRVLARSNENLMSARNLGVVFGPTLMRPSDNSKEFSDMAGKALTIEWLIESAPEIFKDTLQ
ncbi:hypothetical protein FRB99_001691 [Tulasnella sp. 403]|nr:hypothetical protein FRB99_001691 [Tulasnella sp. 403]